MFKEYIIQSIPADVYYAARFKEWSPRAKPNVCCPWHEDKRPSLSLSLRNGGAKCHACNVAKGNIVHFESSLLKCSEAEACTFLMHEFIRPIVPDTTLATLQKALTPKIIATLTAEIGFTEEVCATHHLGWCVASKRVAIPIYDKFGNCVNCRMYKLPSHRTAKEEGLKVLNLKGYGSLDLFSWPMINLFNTDHPIFIMASEKEAILGIREGLQCVAGTGGENAWSQDWAAEFTGFDVCVVAQNDQVGRDAAAQRVAILQQSGCPTSCVSLSPPTALKDFADFILKDGGQGMHLFAAWKAKRAIPSLQSTQQSNRPSPPLPAAKANELTSPELPPVWANGEVAELAALGSNPAMLNMVVHTQGIIAAKATCTYTIPWKFLIRTKLDPPRIYTLPVGRTMIGFIKAPDAVVRAAIRDCIGSKSGDVSSEAFVTTTEIEIIPTASIDKDVPYVTQRCYYLGQRIEANVPYDLQIVPTTDPRTQETIGIVVSAKPISRALDAEAFFESDEIARLQEAFSPKDGEEVWTKLLAIADELSNHHTKIYNRPDWHLVALLTWLCPLGFAFPYEKETQRGWLNSLAIGDTQTGKSKVTQTLHRLLGAGAVINAENCTFVGLVGGAVKMGSGQFMLRWGRIPLCDRQLVVVEELSGLSVDEISNMSDVRSSGIARLDKGGLSAETNARTRLLALSNVRPINKNLAGYLSGVKAVQELVGHSEDIARFDLIITLVDSEVPNNIINRPAHNRNKGVAITEELWRKLCQFVWALKPSQIKITTEAYYLCLKETERLAEIYHPSIPVFKGGSGRYKIARIAAAIACTQFSWHGKNILVHETHVTAATTLLELLYNKPSFGYLEYSKQSYDRDGVKDTKLLDNKIIEVIRNANKRSKVVESMIHASKFTRDELCAVAGLQFVQADDLIGCMVRERVLRKGEANLWEITPAGRDWMQGHLIVD